MTLLFTNTGTGSETGKNKITERVARESEKEREREGDVRVSTNWWTAKPVQFSQTPSLLYCILQCMS